MQGERGSAEALSHGFSLGTAVTQSKNRHETAMQMSNNSFWNHFVADLTRCKTCNASMARQLLYKCRTSEAAQSMFASPLQLLSWSQDGVLPSCGKPHDGDTSSSQCSRRSAGTCGCSPQPDLLCPCSCNPTGVPPSASWARETTGAQTRQLALLCSGRVRMLLHPKAPAHARVHACVACAGERAHR